MDNNGERGSDGGRKTVMARVMVVVVTGWVVGKEVGELVSGQANKKMGIAWHGQRNWKTNRKGLWRGMQRWVGSPLVNGHLHHVSQSFGMIWSAWLGLTWSCTWLWLVVW